MSGPEGSSTKQSPSVCAKGARAELRKEVTHGASRQRRAHGFLERQILIYGFPIKMGIFL